MTSQELLHEKCYLGNVICILLRPNLSSAFLEHDRRPPVELLYAHKPPLGKHKYEK